MKVIDTSIEGLKIINPKVFIDKRGYFFEPYSKKKFDKYLGPVNFVQDNESKSKKGILRGFHFQKPPHDQAKLVRCIRGEILDIAIDIRKGSHTFGEYIKIILSEQNKKQLFIPSGFAHGFLVLTDYAIFSYKVDNYYSPAHESGIKWNDPTLNINWDFDKSNIIVSKKDDKLKLFEDLISPF